MSRDSRPNIRRARGITPDTVRALLGLRHAGTDVAYLPLERVRLTDQVKGGSPRPHIDPADVPACMRPDCTSYADHLMEAVATLRHSEAPALPPPCSITFITPSVAQPEPPRGCDDEARSVPPVQEPTAPSQEEKADAPAITEEFRLGGEDDGAVATGRDPVGRPADATDEDAAPRRVSRPDGRGAAARPARQAAKRDTAATELKQDRLAMIRKLAGQLDLRPASAPSATPAPRPIVAPRNPRKALPVLKADPIAQRREAIERAIRFLKSKAILVDVTDRSAMIRRYRVSGKRDTMLAEEVIEYARQLGMEELG